jgi:hypothetical protein
MIKRRRRAPYALAAAVAAVAAAGFFEAAPLAHANVQITFQTQAMDGNLQVSPGDLLEAGYDFTMPGSHPAANVIFAGAQVTFDAACASGSGGGVITVPMSSGTFVDPLNDGGDWFPTGDQNSLAGYEGAVSVPDLCDGGLVSLQQGGTFTAELESSDPNDPVNVRWHYSADGAAGGWSGTQSFTPGPGGPAAPPPPPQPTQIIVKINLAGGYTIGEITSAFPVEVDPGGLASRGIYLVSPTNPDPQNLQNQLQNLASQINGYQGVVYAQVNLPVQLADTEFFAWPYGSPSPAGNLPATFTGQPAATTLQLTQAQAQSQGAGVIVAVLDTGADPTVPALTGRLLKGWNYVADNANTNDVATSAGNAAVGHGTFVSGLIALVAPQAKILPEKVLDSQGYGNEYSAAQAIMDATAAGAQVINLSFGTDEQPADNLLQEAIQQAQQAGVVVVAAAGNDGSNQQEYPASWSQTLSVAALTTNDSALAPFSNFGGWVDVGAPGEGIVGPMPGGSYDIWAGTSMATPFVSGQAALILSEVPGMQPSQVFQAIEQTATQLPGNPIQSGAINIVSSLAFALAHP